MPVDFSDALDVKPVCYGISENDPALIIANLSLKGMSVREIHDDIVATFGPDAVSYSSVRLPATFARHDFLLPNQSQNPIQPTFNEISMIQIWLF
jgi:hypothetical protein